MQRENIKREKRKTRSVREDWSAWLPEEMDQLFDATRSDLETSNFSLSVALDEALTLCKQGHSTLDKKRVTTLLMLFDHLATRLRLVISAIKEHGIRFGTLPNVRPLSPSNFRGSTAQRISLMDNLLARVGFEDRRRLFHKLYSLEQIIDQLQLESRRAVEGISGEALNDESPEMPSRGIPSRLREPNYSSSTHEVSEVSPEASLSAFFSHISEFPWMKFGIAWSSFGLVVVPLAVLSARGMPERVALFTLLAAILPVQYVIFAGIKKFRAVFRRVGSPNEEQSHEKSFSERRVAADPIRAGMRALHDLEVFGYDLNTCLGETTIMFKSFLCVLPPDELEAFVGELRGRSVIESQGSFASEVEWPGTLSDRFKRLKFLTPEDIATIK
jgi:hypothetical protein